MTGDDIALKYYEIIKGIDEKWVPNKHFQGLYMMKNSVHRPLGKYNKKYKLFY
jgi:hypothetical protein